MTIRPMMQEMHGAVASKGKPDFSDVHGGCLNLFNTKNILPCINIFRYVPGVRDENSKRKPYVPVKI